MRNRDDLESPIELPSIHKLHTALNIVTNLRAPARAKEDLESFTEYLKMGLKTCEQVADGSNMDE